ETEMGGVQVYQTASLSPNPALRIYRLAKVESQWRTHLGVCFRSLPEKVLPNPELNRGAFSQKSLIDFHVDSRHSTLAKATFQCFPAPMALKASQPLNGARRFLDFLDDEAGDAVLHNFRHGAVRPCDHRSAAGHRLDHHQAERFWPVNREKQRVGGAQKFFLLLPPYLADEFDQWRFQPPPADPPQRYPVP